VKVSGRLLVVAAAIIGVDAAALKAWWAHHPVLAAVLSLAWAGVVGVGSVASKVLKPVADKWMDRFGKATDRALELKFSRFEQRYLDHVRSSSRYLNIAGLATPSIANPELDAVFVDIGLDYRLADQATRSIVPATDWSGPSERFSIWSQIERVQPARLVLLGAPGSGKSTLLRHVAGLLALRGAQWRRPLPVLLILQKHAAQISGSAQPTLTDVIDASLARFELHTPDGWWESRLKAGDCVVLLDGLDEVADTAQRDAMSRWIAAQIEVYPRCDFVVTSRPHGYTSTLPIPGARVLETQPFTDDQVRQYLTAWYRAEERVATQNRGPDVDMVADEKSDELLRLLVANPNLDVLKANPLLLTMIANVHRYRGALPGGRAELYKEVCEVMLWRRQRARDLPSRLSGTVKTSLLAELALTMMRSQVRETTWLQAEQWLAGSLARNADGGTVREFLDDILACGLLVERELGAITFAHLTFQEYLAATVIGGAELAGHVADQWWRETTLLHVARGGSADPIVAASLADINAESLSLAFDCTEGGVPLAPDLRSRLTAILEDAFSDGPPNEWRHIVARVLADRHFRDSVRMVAGVRTDAYRAIPSNLYRLFVLDTNCPYPDGTLAVEAQATIPVTGMRHEDVLSFATWLQQITGKNHRLPTTKELADLPEAPPVVWSHEVDLEVWTAPGRGPGADEELIVPTIAADLVEFDILRLLHLIFLKRHLEGLVTRFARDNFFSPLTEAVRIAVNDVIDAYHNEGIAAAHQKLFLGSDPLDRLDMPSDRIAIESFFRSSAASRLGLADIERTLQLLDRAIDEIRAQSRAAQSMVEAFEGMKRGTDWSRAVAMARYDSAALARRLLAGIRGLADPDEDLLDLRHLRAPSMPSRHGVIEIEYTAAIDQRLLNQRQISDLRLTALAKAVYDSSDARALYQIVLGLTSLQLRRENPELLERLILIRT
jgi:hypothetical protein